MITEPNVELNADESEKQQQPPPSQDEPPPPPPTTSTSQQHHPTPSTSSNVDHDQLQPTKPNAQQNFVEDEGGDSESTYHLKWIPWNSGKIPIVMQSINGPCPLIATMNVLLLREKVKLPQMLEQITATQLLAYIGECIMDSVSNPNELIVGDGSSGGVGTATNADDALLNLEQNIHDAMEILPKLKTGLDVNIRFTGITDFEYTPECIVFDLLRIPLYHGWLCDPSSPELTRAINTQSYNQLVDMIITNKSSQDPDKLLNVLIAEEFLEGTASQLTLPGLNELRTKIKDNEIGILFRNNHFLTLFKRESVIYTLVTDHGYLTEDNIIWETLDNIEGAGRFMDSNFQLAETTNRQVSELNAIDQRQQQMENDFLMALSLKAEESMEQQQQQTSDNNQPNNRNDNPPSSTSIINNTSDQHRQQSAAATTTSPLLNLQDLDDFELAKRLQDEENQIYEEMMRERQSRAASDQRLALVVAEDQQHHRSGASQLPVSSSAEARISSISAEQAKNEPTKQAIVSSTTTPATNYNVSDEFPPLPSTTSAATISNLAQRANQLDPQQQQHHHHPQLPTSCSNQIDISATHRHDQQSDVEPPPPSTTTSVTGSRSQDDLSAHQQQQFSSGSNHNQQHHQHHHHHHHHQQQPRTTSATSSNGGRRSRNENKPTKDSNCSIS